MMMVHGVVVRGVVVRGVVVRGVDTRVIMAATPDITAATPDITAATPDITAATPDIMAAAIPDIGVIIPVIMAAIPDITGKMRLLPMMRHPKNRLPKTKGNNQYYQLLPKRVHPRFFLPGKGIPSKPQRLYLRPLGDIMIASMEKIAFRG